MKYLARAFAPQILIGLVGGLMLTLLFLWLAIAGSAVPLAPHNVPVAVPIMFFGVPASPLPGPWNWQPAVFRVLGPFGPFGAATNGDINGIFFPQASQAENLWVLLGLWMGVPVLLLLGLGRQSQRTRGSAAGKPNVADPVGRTQGLPDPGATT